MYDKYKDFFYESQKQTNFNLSVSTVIFYVNIRTGVFFYAREFKYYVTAYLICFTWKLANAKHLLLKSQSLLPI